MFHIGCTRFNNATYNENIKYRKESDEPVIYGAALKIRKTYSPDSLMFIAEMNNDKNRVEGIGLIRNKLVHDKRHKIYENSEYNRYIYRGNYWLSREQLLDLDPEILEILDTVLFKGKSHLKCRTGISILSEKLFIHWIYELRTLKHKIKEVFLQHFNTCDDIETYLDNTESVRETKSVRETELEN
jgi:hypothetical protein